jgi:hypothetical protein
MWERCPAMVEGGAGLSLLYEPREHLDVARVWPARAILVATILRHLSRHPVARLRQNCRIWQGGGHTQKSGQEKGARGRKVAIHRAVGQRVFAMKCRWPGCNAAPLPKGSALRTSTLLSTVHAESQELRCILRKSREACWSYITCAVYRTAALSYARRSQAGKTHAWIRLLMKCNFAWSASVSRTCHVRQATRK